MEQGVEDWYDIDNNKIVIIEEDKEIIEEEQISFISQTINNEEPPHELILSETLDKNEEFINITHEIQNITTVSLAFASFIGVCYLFKK